MEEKKPNNNKTIIISIILLIIGFLLGLYFGNNLNNKHNDKTTKEENTKTEEVIDIQDDEDNSDLEVSDDEEENISNEEVTSEQNENLEENNKAEVKITDRSIIEKLKARQVIINNYTSDDIVYKKSRIYQNKITNANLRKDMKLLSILYTLVFDLKEFQDIGSKYPNVERDPSGTFFISSDRVKELYKEVYGDILDTSTSIPEKAAGNFFYNSEYDIYVEYSGFGGTCADKTYIYDYDYTSDINYLYVYTAFAYEANCPYAIYKDLDKKEKYDYSKIDFDLNENNYKDFHHYRVAYSKDNYRFVGVEKIN